MDLTKCKNKESFYQKRYSAWCDQMIGTFDLNGLETRSTWCRSKKKPTEMCKTKKDFDYCFMQYYGCTAKKRDTKRCCTGWLASTTPTPTTTAPPATTPPPPPPTKEGPPP